VCTHRGRQRPGDHHTGHPTRQLLRDEMREDLVRRQLPQRRVRIVLVKRAAITSNLSETIAESQANGGLLVNLQQADTHEVEEAPRRYRHHRAHNNRLPRLT
jgi:hypothetical protein